MIDANCILFDYFSFTSKEHTPLYIAKLLGMDLEVFIPRMGTRGYKHGLIYEGISIFYDGPTVTWCEMSGSGCRTFETHGNGDWNALFNEVLSDDLYHITRLDVAFDEREGLLDIYQMKKDAEAENFHGRFRWNKTEYMIGNKAVSIYHGSPKSDVRYRIYDKAKERELDESVHWIRFEIQMRNEHARGFLTYLPMMEIGELFVSVINNDLRYIQPPDGNDQRKRRWPTADYWENFIGSAKKVSLYQKPGTEYNLGNLEHYAIGMAGAAAAVYVDIHGVDVFLSKVTEKLRSNKNPKYKDLLDQFSKKGLPIREVKQIDIPDNDIYCTCCGRVKKSSAFSYYSLRDKSGVCSDCNLKAVLTAGKILGG